MMHKSKLMEKVRYLRSTLHLVVYWPGIKNALETWKFLKKPLMSAPAQINNHVGIVTKLHCLPLLFLQRLRIVDELVLSKAVSSLNLVVLCS